LRLFLSDTSNFISINSGVSYRIADKEMFGYRTVEGRHSDVPSYCFGLNYGRKISEFNNGSKTIALIGFTSQGVVGKKLYFPSKPDPIWGYVLDDSYYRKYEIRYQNIQIGASQWFKVTEKIDLSGTLYGNYLFRYNSKTFTKYPSNDEFRSFSKFKGYSSIVPDSTYQRITASAEIGFKYSLFDKSIVSVDLGSYFVNLRDEKRQVLPIWLVCGYKYVF
jgi:hypothetical protein